MIHYTYKITDPHSGRYYVGRHSTENINDSYIGSGKWIRSLNDKKNLIKEILSYYDDFKSLCEAEETLITEHYNNELNMKNPEILKKFQKPQERIEYPHCGKIGGKSLIKRYHFDNCTKSTTAVAQNFNFYK
jgi:hypothetical protein